MSRLADLRHFYDLMGGLADRIGGPTTLIDLQTSTSLPGRGVYFFFEQGEDRTDSGNGPRVARVGTHALKVGSSSTLTQRLQNHRGQISGGGNHRGSIFRLLVGQALLARGEVAGCPSWGVAGDLGKAATVLNVERDALKTSERPVENVVTRYIGRMPFLWLDIPDEPSPHSLRGLIERNTIALLSNANREPLDAASSNWLGNHSNRHLVRTSGIWNQSHVREAHDPTFLAMLETLVDQMEMAT